MFIQIVRGVTKLKPRFISDSIPKFLLWYYIASEEIWEMKQKYSIFRAAIY